MSRTRRMFGYQDQHASPSDVPAPTTATHDGYPAYERPLEEVYLQTLLTNTLGNTYYASGEELLREADEIHGAMIAKDPLFAARALVFARRKGYMRLQPIFGLAKLAKAKPGLFAHAFPGVIRTPADLADFMTILRSQGRGEGGRAVKRAATQYLRDAMSQYWALKYGGRGRGYSIGDLIATCHPKPKDAQQAAIFAYLRRRECELELVPQIRALEALKAASTDEERIALISAGRLPHEAVTGAVRNPSREVWGAIGRQLPTFALLRHLRALERSGALEDLREHVTAQLTNPRAIAGSMILPSRFLAAMGKVETAWVRDVLRIAVDLAFQNVPAVPGYTAIFVDTSGSMDGDMVRTAGLFAFALYKRTGDGLVWAFDTEVTDLRPSRVDSILSQAERLGAGGGTDTGAPVARLIRQGRRVDNIVIVTDEQQNTGEPFIVRVQDYRRRVNPEVKVFVIDVSPYGRAMVPEQDRLTWYCYGWSDKVLHFVALAAEGFASMVDVVRASSLNDLASAGDLQPSPADD